jgi:ribulose-phosphate 3-epimerase
MLHVDVMDGIFVKNTTWSPPDRMRVLLEGIPFEAHLMVSNPEHAAPIWLACGASRVIFHVEATTKESLICRATAEECENLALAINPDTPISRLTHLLDTFKQVMVMGVTPGWSGQPFQQIALEKIAMLKSLRPSLKVIVDGGVNTGNAAGIVAAGADVLVSGSALTEHPDPAEAFMALKTSVHSRTLDV